MYAFGLVENGEYRAAERIARRALAIDPRHLGAVHVVAHVMEMQGRASDGLAFLAETAAAWPEGSGFAVHLAWHRALFHLDADDLQTALAVYDLAIANAPAYNLAALADASALLWRLQLGDVDVGARWRLLADRWEQHALLGAQPFFVVHAMMAFARAGRTAAAERALLALVRGGRAAGYSEDALFPPLARALLAYARDDYSACIDWLVRVRHIADRCGGSVAQCDIIHLTYTEAAFRAREDRLARALVAERSALKPKSRLNRRLQERLQRIPARAERPAPSPGLQLQPA
jgi:tetratricopeptide (TPR) repeat protein